MFVNKFKLGAYFFQTRPTQYVNFWILWPAFIKFLRDVYESDVVGVSVIIVQLEFEDATEKSQQILTFVHFRIKISKDAR